jgi:hypothetical protein
VRRGGDDRLPNLGERGALLGGKASQVLIDAGGFGHARLYSVPRAFSMPRRALPPRAAQRPPIAA